MHALSGQNDVHGKQEDPNDIYKKSRESIMTKDHSITHGFFLGPRWRASSSGRRLEVGKGGEMSSSMELCEVGNIVLQDIV